MVFVAFEDACSCWLRPQVWPWEMERLAGGVVHIPIFLSALQPGLYYTQILVCSTSRGIPYDGPTDDLDLAASYVFPATGK